MITKGQEGGGGREGGGGGGRGGGWGINPSIFNLQSLNRNSKYQI